MPKEITIIGCPVCKTKNRVRSYSGKKTPVCAKCRTPLVNEAENEALKDYDKKLDEFMNLPDLNVMPDN